MKWIFIAGLAASILPLTFLIRNNARHAALVWTIFGFVAVQHGPLHLIVGPISWAMWPGFVKGVDVSLLDGLAVAILLSLPKPKALFPLSVVMSFYILTALLAANEASSTEAALFFVWQTLRVFFIAYVVSRAIAANPRLIAPLMQGMGFGLLLACALAILDRTAFGILQARGGFTHQNQLGMITHFVAIPYLALLLAGASGWLTYIVPLAGAMIAGLTASRGTVAVLFLGYAVLMTLSAARTWTRRKGRLIVYALMGAAMMTPIAVMSLNSRLGEQAVVSVDEEREAFERAARMIIEDHPMGIGPNHYVVVSNTQGYADRAGVAANFVNRAAHVHNIYLLSEAETGQLGLFAYICLLLQPLFIAFRSAYRGRPDWRHEVLLGCGVTLSAVYAHSFLEWIFVSFQVQYLFAVTIGVVIGLSQDLRRRARGAAQSGFPSRRRCQEEAGSE